MTEILHTDDKETKISNNLENYPMIEIIIKSIILYNMETSYSLR